jgi:hypothetical protein
LPTAARPPSPDVLGKRFDKNSIQMTSSTLSTGMKRPASAMSGSQSTIAFQSSPIKSEKTGSPSTSPSQLNVSSAQLYSSRTNAGTVVDTYEPENFSSLVGTGSSYTRLPLSTLKQFGYATSAPIAEFSKIKEYV